MTRTQPADPCARHRTALLEVAAGRPLDASLANAVDHAGRCRACEDELAAATLLMIGLGRLRGEAGRAEPPPNAWMDLRERIRPGPSLPWLRRSPMGGLLMSLGLVVALVGPLAMSSGGSLPGSDGDPSIPVVTGAGSNAIDPGQPRLRTSEPPASPRAPADGTPASAATRLGPDGLPPARALEVPIAAPGRGRIR